MTVAGVGAWRARSLAERCLRFAICAFVASAAYHLQIAIHTFPLNETLHLINVNSDVHLDV